MPLIRLFVLAALSALALASASADTARQPITSIREVRNLSISEAAKGLPIALKAQILHIGIEQSGVFIGQDDTAIYAAIPHKLKAAHPYKLGSWIRIQGQTHQGSFIPHLEIENIELLEWAPLPEALPITYDNLFSPELDCKWVSVEGFVLGINITPSYITLEVETFGSLIDVILINNPEAEEKARQLIHRHIKLRGVAASQANDRRQLTGRNIRVHDFEEIDLAVSRGEIPLVSLDKLLTPQWSSVRKVRIQGVVTSAKYQRLYIRGAGRSILAKVRGGVDAKIGDIVEVLGTVSVEPFSPTLYAEQITILGGDANAEPVLFNPTTDAYSSTLNNELITTPGELLGIGETENSEQTILQCRSGSTTFDVVFPGSSDTIFQPGSLLRFTGICQLIDKSFRPDVSSIEGFRISLRSVNDIELLTPASWWTLRRMLIGFATAIAATLFALTWAISLRKRVAFQTDIMRNQVEREAMLSERHRIARELHDTVEQNMVGLSMQLDNVSQAIKKGDPSTSARALKIAAHMLHACRTEARDSVLELRAAFQQGISIADIVDDSVLETIAHANVSFSRKTTGTIFDLGHFRTRQTLRAIQEAILNATKHASPQNIQLTAAYSSSELTVSVTDDGSGFDTTTPPPKGHFGLVGMRERCERIGAKFSMKSIPGSTEITFKIPSKEN